MMTPHDLKARTFQFGIATIRFVRRIPRDPDLTFVRGQLIRASTSVGANYRAACRGRSRAEFISKIGQTIEEGDESMYWLEVLHEAGLLDRLPMWKELHSEANQLVAILAKSQKTAGDNETRERNRRRGTRPPNPPARCPSVTPRTPSSDEY